MDVPDGWQPVAPTLVDILRDHGFTVAAPSPASTPAGHSVGGALTASPPSDDGVNGWVLSAGAAALVVLVGVAAWLGRPRTARLRPHARGV